MRAVIQRVKSAEVRVRGEVRGKISRGLLVFLGVEKGDSEKDRDYLVSKVLGLRIFEDEAGKMNLDVKNVGGALLVVSQFTLMGDGRKGKRPSFTEAEEPQRAALLYKETMEKMRQQGISVEEGEFQADMDVELVNDGPVTILLDSRKKF